jgi:hypothetical protein
MSAFAFVVEGDSIYNFGIHIFPCIVLLFRANRGQSRVDRLEISPGRALERLRRAGALPDVPAPFPSERVQTAWSGSSLFRALPLGTRARRTPTETSSPLPHGMPAHLFSGHPSRVSPLPNKASVAYKREQDPPRAELATRSLPVLCRLRHYCRHTELAPPVVPAIILRH